MHQAKARLNKSKKEIIYNIKPSTSSIIQGWHGTVSHDKPKEHTDLHENVI